MGCNARKTNNKRCCPSHSNYRQTFPIYYQMFWYYFHISKKNPTSKLAVLWDAMPYSLIETLHCFTGMNRLHFKGTFLPPAPPPPKKKGSAHLTQTLTPFYHSIQHHKVIINLLKPTSYVMHQRV